MKLRRYILAISILVFVMSLAGCGNTQEDDLESMSEESAIDDTQEIETVVVDIWEEVEREEINELCDANEAPDDSVWEVGQGVTPIPTQSSSSSSNSSSQSSSSSSAKFILNPTLKACVQGTNATLKSKLGSYSCESFLGNQGVPFVNYYDYANSISYETSLTDTSSAAYAEWDKAYGDGSNGLPQYNCFSDSYAVSSIRVAGSNCINKVFQAQEGGFDFTTEFLSSELNQLQDGVTVNVLTDNGVDTIPYTVFTYTMEGCTMDLYYLDGATPEYIIIY